MWVKAIICAIISVMCLFDYNIQWLSTIQIVLFILLFIFEYKKYLNFNFVLFELLIISLPFSFFAIIGEKFISIFVLLQIFFIFNFLRSKKYTTKGLKVYLVVLILLITIQYIISQSIYHTLHIEGFIKIIIFLFPLLAVLHSVSFTKEQIYYLLKLFVITGFIAGLTVTIQFSLNRWFGISDLGMQVEKETRLGFAGLFFDYSIMSVYMGTTAVLLFTDILSSNRLFNRYWNILLCLFFIFISILTSARSGFVSIICSILLYLIVYKNFKKSVIVFLISIPLIYLFINYYNFVREINFVSDNGRFEIFQKTFNYIAQNPFMGTGGLGYFETTGNMRVHNFILEWGAEYGILIAALLIGLFFALLSYIQKVFPNLFFFLLCCMIGGLFHSSLINSHYFVIPSYLIAAYKE